MITPMAAYTKTLVGEAAQDPKRLYAWQLKRAIEALCRAKTSSLFYAAQLADVDELVLTAQTWDTVPTMTDKNLTDAFSLLCVPAREIARVITISTSGTVAPKRVLFSQNDLAATTAFFEHGMSTMVDAGQHVAVLMRGTEPHTIGDLLQKGLAGIDVSASVLFPFDDTVGQVLKNADCIVGLPVPTLRLARKHPKLRPKTVLLSADYVPQSVIFGIETLWHCRVLTHYGLTETGYGLGVQCLCTQGYHLRDAEYLCEILDVDTHKPLATGETGEVVLTTLAHRAMPLIRYRTGDIARMNTISCDCGAPLLTLDKVMGRIGDDGMLSMPKLDEAVFSVETVYDMQAVQRGRNIQLLVDCVPGSETQTKEHILQAVGQEIDIAFVSLDMRLRKRRVDVQFDV